ncbi:MAG TPA: rhodanese-like domain-containing protein [Candidatus Binatia bacterium]|jgi:rhodanese-related sulfurtransferase|nr:rhodanese-like domain-containing protein [Candidatus Binatia bacterium]
MAKQQKQVTGTEHLTISREEILNRLQDRALVIVNVTPKESFVEGHIHGSINLPVADIESKARQLISNPSHEIAVYCAGPT